MVLEKSNPLGFRAQTSPATLDMTLLSKGYVMGDELAKIWKSS